MMVMIFSLLRAWNFVSYYNRTIVLFSLEQGFLASTLRESKGPSFLQGCLLVMGVVIFCRLLTLGMAPLFDTTENRYANIAQQMILRHDWLTPYIPAFHEPFLGKPPLSFWLDALSFKAFSCNEFAARFPNFVQGLLFLWFTFLVGRKLFDRRTAVLAPLILCSNVLFFLESGTVGMDMGVGLMTVASMWAYLCIHKAAEERNTWRQAFYEVLLGLWFGFGMLNKGPVSLVLFLGSIGLFAIAKRKPFLLFLPRWWIVLPVMAVVSFPWYFAMQQANPDFFNYFLVHEHFLRYLKSSYGDRYGAGHNQPYGMAWPMLVLSFLPWCVFLLPVGVWLKRTWKEKEIGLSDTYLLLLSWLVFTPLFFTFARSMLPSYLLTSFPPMALLCGRMLSLQLHALKAGKHTSGWQAAMPFFAAVLTALSGFIMLAIYFDVFLSRRPVLLLYGLVLILACIGLGWAYKRPATLRTQVGLWLIALCFGLSIGAWFGFLWEGRGGAKSMKSAIVLLSERLPEYHRREVASWGKTAPFSWYFYSQVDAVNAMSSSQAPVFLPEPMEYETLPRGRRLLLIVTKSSLASFRLKYPRFARNPLVSSGNYLIFDLPAL